MSLIDGLRHRLGAFLKRDAYERELDDELRFHLDVEVMHEEHAGRSRDDARAVARSRLGHVTSIREEHRRVAGVAFLDILRQDLRFAFRGWRTRAGRGPAIVTILTLAVGIGAMTAISTIVRGILVQPLPVRDPGRLVAIQLVEPAERGRELFGSVATMEVVRAWRAADVLDGIAAYSLHRATVTGLGPTHQVRAFPVTTNMFELLGVTPVRGRSFVREEGAPGARPVVIVNSTFAARHFGGDSGAIGQSVTLDGTSREIVGVMAADFHVPGSAPWVAPEGELWTPLPVFPDRPRSAATSADILARLAPGVSVGAAQARLDTLLAATALPTDLGIYGKVSQIMSPHRMLVDDVRTPLLLLTAGSAVLLLVACANVANLMLARAVVRRREMAVRTALGAGRGRLARQLLTESAALSLVGGGLGVLVAYAALPLILRLAGNHLPPLGTIAIDAGVLGAALAVAILLGMLLGVAPVMEAGREIPQASLKSGAANTTLARRTRWATDALVAAEVGLALALLAAMGLVTRSFIAVMTLDRGYDTESVLVARVAVPESRYETPSAHASLTRTVVERLGALPGVTSVAAADAGPILRSRTSRFTTTGIPPTVDSPGGELWAVTPAYFRTMGIPLRRGRTAADPDELVIDETAARTLVPHGDPLGQRLTWGSALRPRPATSGQGVIVGIVGDIREYTTGGRDNRVHSPPHVYRYLAGHPANLFIARVAGGDPELISAAVRSAFAEIDRDLIVDLTQSGSGMIRTWFSRQRFLTQLMLSLAAVALLLATIGIYSVVSYAAARRTREVGIRMALGARRVAIVSLVMRQAMTPVAIGVVLGLAMSVAGSRVIRQQLFGVSPTDPLVLVAVTSVLVLAALFAGYLPSRRATRVDPTSVLREE